MKKFLTLILTIVLLATSLTMTSCAPSKKSAVIPVDYMVTYTYINAYGEEMVYTTGANLKDYEDDYYFFSDGKTEIVEKAPHGSGLSSFWKRDVSENKNTKFEAVDTATFKLPDFYGVKLFNFGTYTGDENLVSSAGVDWKKAGELEEIEFDKELGSYENGLLAGREVTFYSFAKTNGKYGNATVALDNKYAFVMYFSFESLPELKDKQTAVDKERYKPYQGPISLLVCTSCLLDEEAPIIADMLP